MRSPACRWLNSFLLQRLFLISASYIQMQLCGYKQSLNISIARMNLFKLWPGYFWLEAWSFKLFLGMFCFNCQQLYTFDTALRQASAHFLYWNELDFKSCGLSGEDWFFAEASELWFVQLVNVTLYQLFLYWDLYLIWKLNKLMFYWCMVC